MSKTEVFIVGAGPTGLVLALWLTKMGINIRIIDKNAKAGTTSRAIIIHARTMEFFAQLGIDEICVSNGLEVKAANVLVRGKKVGRVEFGNPGAIVTPYPFMLIYPQDQLEQTLEEQLNLLGIYVERNTELVSINTSTDIVQVELRKVSGEVESCQTSYLAGCDGAHSSVREKLQIGFPGGTYQETFYVADLQANGPLVNGELNAALDDTDFLAMFPLKGNGRIRLVGSVSQESKNKNDLQWSDVNKEIVEKLKLNIETVKWFSSYRVHHRVAQHFRKQNVFLLGDAAHIHSPVGGQGMNTGVGDAVNLAWKLANVLKGHSPASILDTYEQERIPFANKLVNTTDRAFSFITAKGSFASRVRIHVVPLIVTVMFKFSFFQRLFFRTISQTLIKYDKSDLSSESAGKIRIGDRLPWIGANFNPLHSMQWQVHTYGDNSKQMEALCNERTLKYYVFPFTERCRSVGFKKNAAYVVRPDGHIGLIVTEENILNCKGYIDKWWLKAGYNVL